MTSSVILSEVCAASHPPYPQTCHSERSIPCAKRKECESKNPYPLNGSQSVLTSWKYSNYTIDNKLFKAIL